jgi:hypothetical protein
VEQLVASLIFFAVGVGLLAGAAFAWLHTRRFVAEAVRGFGEVVRLQERSDDSVTYSPVIRFSGPGGRAVEFTESTSSNPPGYSVGDRVEILYRPHDPERARLASPWRLYLLAGILGTIGGVFSLLGLLLSVLALLW